MNENSLVTGDTKGIVPVNADIIQAAALESDFALSRTLKTSLRDAQTPVAEIRIYALSTGVLYDLLASDSISEAQFDRRFSTLVALDTTTVDANHQIVPTAPKKKSRKEDEYTGQHGRIIQMLKIGLEKDPDKWEAISSVISTKQMEKLGRQDLLYCPPERMSQYLSNSVYRSDDAYSEDWSDVNFLVHTIIERGDDIDDGDFIEEVRELLERNEPGAYKTLVKKARRGHADWLIDFLTEAVVEEPDFDDDDDEFYE